MHNPVQDCPGGVCALSEQKTPFVLAHTMPNWACTCNVLCWVRPLNERPCARNCRNRHLSSPRVGESTLLRQQTLFPSQKCPRKGGFSACALQPGEQFSDQNFPPVKSPPYALVSGSGSAWAVLEHFRGKLSTVFASARS